MAQTKRDIKALLDSVGIRPLKRFGQNFLIDGNLLRKLVAVADVKANDVVLEVGPGTGTLTEELLQRAGHVVAVEIDRGLSGICVQRFGASDRFTLLNEDVLRRKSRINPAVLESLDQHQRRLGGRIMLVANLPYDVATPLLMELIQDERLISPLCFTVQAEMADRLIAETGTKAYGPVSILTQLLTDARRIANAPPSAFWPPPQVNSTMMRLDRKHDTTMTSALQERLAALVHDSFLHRRKTLQWNLRKALGPDELERIESAGTWDLTKRPEQFAPDQWRAMAAIITTSA